MSASPRAEKHESGGGSESQAKEYCLRVLTARNYTSAELEAKLAARGFEPEVAGRAITRLIEVGLVDDHAFAQMFARTRHARDRRGKRVIAMELKRKGIPELEVAEAVAQVSDDDERNVAVELVRKSMRGADWTTDPAEKSKQMRRALGVLARRGFDAGMAMEVVRSEFD
jgi:regulatory protein